MIEETVAKIEAALREVQLADPQNKAELVALLEKLKAEVKKDELSRAEIDSTGAMLKMAALDFESSHPSLSSLINEVSLMLAKIGI
ncbi:MAG: hypothetical protein COV48_03925 [Elusimicrobia bacterium CG11_big_fil_rev_8_21_14_0_20_64_6]|nr:MAG: hypothetical protein COV48_03925 [Elusimicrobia bacterium CG11_big_fil_rev_8_21_14_0_20_64_6]